VSSVVTITTIGVMPGSTTITNNASTPYTFTGGAITGSGALLKQGTGTVTFQNVNTYTGATTVAGGTFNIASGGSISNTGGIYLTGSGASLNVQTGGQITGGGQTYVTSGTLSVNGSASGVITVSGGGTLHGTGTIGAVVVNSGGHISAGNSVGGMTLNGSGVSGGSSLTLNSGADLVFEFNNATGAGGTTNGWDMIDLGTGVLNIGADNYSQSSMITLHVDSWLPNNSGPGAAANFDPLAGTPGNPTTGYFWKFIAVDSDSKINITSGLPGSVGGRFLVIDDGVFAGNNPFTRPSTSIGQGTFRVLTGAELGMSPGLYLVYSAIPEPGTMILTGLASLGAGWYGRRRLRKAKAAAEAASPTDAEPPTAETPTA
jgi:autotransporter-associated beta strand protein